jgi:ABC-type sugar transport system permease subunit
MMMHSVMIATLTIDENSFFEKMYRQYLATPWTLPSVFVANRSAFEYSQNVALCSKIRMVLNILV